MVFKIGAAPRGTSRGDAQRHKQAAAKRARESEIQERDRLRASAAKIGGSVQASRFAIPPITTQPAKPSAHAEQRTLFQVPPVPARAQPRQETKRERLMRMRREEFEMRQKMSRRQNDSKSQTTVAEKNDSKEPFEIQKRNSVKAPPYDHIGETPTAPQSPVSPPFRSLVAASPSPPSPTFNIRLDMNAHVRPNPVRVKKVQFSPQDHSARYKTPRTQRKQQNAETNGSFFDKFGSHEKQLRERRHAEQERYRKQLDLQMQSRKSRSDVASNDNSDSIQDEKHDQVPHRSVEQDTSHGTAAFEIGLSENEIRKKKVRQQLLQRALLDEQISERQRIMEARKKAELGHPEVEIPKDEEQTRPSIFSFTGSAPASPLSAIAPIDKRQESTPKKYEKLRRQRKENTNVWIKQQRTPLQKSTGTGISPVVQEGLPDPEVQSTFLAAFRDTINATVATLREAIRQSADASKSTTWVPQHRDTEPKAPEIEPSQIVDEAVQKLKSELSAQQAVHSAELDSIRSQLDELVKAEVKRQEEQCRTEQLQRVEVDENVMRPVGKSSQDRELSSHKIFLKNANTAHSSPLRPTSTRTVSSDIRDNRAPKFSQEAPLRRRKGSASRRSSVFKPSQRNSDSSIPVERYVVNEQSEASRSSIENMLEAETKLVPVEEVPAELQLFPATSRSPSFENSQAAVVESSFGGETSQARSEGVLWPVASQDDEECSFDVLELDRSMRRKLSAALEIAKVIGPEMCEQPSQVPQYAVLPLSEQGQVKAASAMRAYARRFLRNEVGTTGANFADNEAPDDPRVDALLRALASEEDDDLHFAQQAESVFDEVSVSDADESVATFESHFLRDEPVVTCKERTIVHHDSCFSSPPSP